MISHTTLCALELEFRTNSNYHWKMAFVICYKMAQEYCTFVVCHGFINLISTVYHLF